MNRPGLVALPASAGSEGSVGPPNKPASLVTYNDAILKDVYDLAKIIDCSVIGLCEVV